MKPTETRASFKNFFLNPSHATFTKIVLETQKFIQIKCVLQVP